ncbi:MAG: tetratricopeptide repeat protein [Chitinophagaceae bacterium]|nr:tetratricopeptide repeat protein [Chitinophagaceae bacterium]
MRCHEDKYDMPSHTFHAVNTAGALCKSCHMPTETYMGNDVRHDHFFRAPRPDLTVKYGMPNACNQCHSDKSAQWAANAVEKWYGPVRPAHFAEDLILASREDSATIKHVIKLVSDTANAEIVKAAGLYYLRNIVDPQSAGLLIKELGNSSAQIRYQALRSLSNFPPETWINQVLPLMSDKVRAVRIAAADLLLTVPSSRIPTAYQSAFTSAKNELQQYILYQTDFAMGNIMAGDYYLRQNDFRSSQFFYERALKKDDQLNEARLNLSVVYSSLGKNKEALEVLQQALKVQPKNDRIYFNLALLYNELNDKEKAESSLAEAAKLNSQNPRVYYNYGLMLQQRGMMEAATGQLQKAVELAPEDGDLNYALCWIYFQTGKVEKAKDVARKLRRINPGNPTYEQLARQLGL